jgi:hypothetical protein
MPSQLKRALFGLFIVVCAPAVGSGVDVFGKGSVSKSFISSNNSTQEVSLSGGVAIGLLSGVRLEARYTNISALQSELEIVSSSVIGTLNSIKTETSIVSLGLDIEFLSEKSAFQPFIYVGAGYIQTSRSYYFTQAGSSTSSYYSEPKQSGISANGGIGLRLRLAKNLALELELFAYGVDVQKPNPLINYIGTAGVRIFM